MPSPIAIHSAPSDTVTADTIVVDSNAVLLTPHYIDGFPAIDSLGADSAVITASASMTTLSTMKEPLAGEGKTFTANPLHDTSCMALMLTGLVLIMVSFRTGYKYLEDLMHNMFSIRRRENLFEDHTLNETRILTALTT